MKKVLLATAVMALLGSGAASATSVDLYFTSHSAPASCNVEVISGDGEIQYLDDLKYGAISGQPAALDVQVRKRGNQIAAPTMTVIGFDSIGYTIESPVRSDSMLGINNQRIAASVTDPIAISEGLNEVRLAVPTKFEEFAEVDTAQTIRLATEVSCNISDVPAPLPPQPPVELPDDFETPEVV